MGICEVIGCGKEAKGRLCGMHRQRFSRHGSVDAGRPKGWGLARRHPVYEAWRSMRRAAPRRGGTDPRWSDFWAFLEDVGEKPSPHHTLKRRDARAPYDKANCYWHAPIAPDTKQLEGRAAKAAYMRAFNAEKPHLLKRSLLKREYGITLEDYEGMLAAQGGVCAICRQAERHIHRKTGAPMMLAVDHIHDEIGRVRGLLCGDCNRALGLFSDDPLRLQAAIEYLKKHASIRSDG